MMRCHGIEQPSDIPLSLAAIETLALEATSRDLSIAELVGQILVSAINKDMIHKISRLIDKAGPLARRPSSTDNVNQTG